MSGPKIVDIRIVRAAEDRLWSVLQVRLRKALQAWREAAANCPAGVPADVESSLQSSLADLEAAQQGIAPPRSIRTVLDAAQAQLQFIRDETRLLKTETAEQKARQYQHHRALEGAIQAAAERLAAAGLEQARADLLSAGTETALETALALLAGAEQKKETELLQRAADSFGGASGGAITLNDWLGRHAASTQMTEDATLRRLDRLAAELAATAGNDAAVSWLERIDTVRRLADERTRTLRTDSLVLELVENLAREKREQERLERLDELEAELAAFAAAPAELTQKITALRAASGADVAALAAEVAAWCETEARRLDAVRIRETVLFALRDLGYEVREGMAAAWTEEGQLVVRQPGSADYGVELRDVGDRMRTQLVRYGDPGAETTPAQRQRDLEKETQWCSDHGAVLQALADQGLTAQILASRPVGAVPVAVVPAVTAPGRGDIIERPKERRFG